MSYYQMGLAVPNQVARPSLYRQGATVGERVGGFQFWRGVKTPSMIRGEIDRILAEFVSTGKDLRAELEKLGGYPEDLADRPESVEPFLRFYRDVWSPYYQSFEAFRNTHQGTWNNLWGDAWDEAQVFQAGLIKIRAKAREVGFRLKLSVEPVTQPDDSLAAGIQALLWTILKFTVIGGAVFLLFLFISKKIG